MLYLGFGIICLTMTLKLRCHPIAGVSLLYSQSRDVEAKDWKSSVPFHLVGLEFLTSKGRLPSTGNVGIIPPVLIGS